MAWKRPSEPLSDEETGATPAWLLSFVDLASLLLSFMVLVFAFSRLDHEAWPQAASAIRTHFGGPAWMQPKTLPTFTIAQAPELPAMNLGYLNLLLDQRFTAIAVPSRSRLQPGRLVLTLAPADGGRSQQLQQLGSLLARVGNVIVIETSITMAADEGEAAAHAWDAAFAEAAAVAAALRASGIDAKRVALSVSAAPNPNAASEAEGPKTSARTDVAVLDHGGSR